ncbi:MAG: cytochrome c [Planctomycetota bacterium]
MARSPFPMSHAFVSAAVLAMAAGPLAGCRGERTDKPPRQFFPDMDDPPRFEAQYETAFFEDGRTQRQPVEGTVAYARWTGDVYADSFVNAEWSGPILEERARLLRADRELYYGSVETPGFGPTDTAFWSSEIPVPVDRDFILRGQEKFNIYCSACHGIEGNGQGMVGRRWSYPVPSFHDDKYQREAGEGDEAERTGRDGYLFHVSRNGIPNEANPGYYRMPPYKHAINERDAWAVVAYIRTLQATRRGTLDDVSEQERQRLNEMRGMPAAMGDAPDPADRVGLATPGEGGTR